MKVTSSWARPIQGISQQPLKVMKEGQCQEQINMVPSVVRGLEKRFGTDHVAWLMAYLHPDAKIHHYARGDGEEYFVVIQPDGSIKVFGANGVQHTVVATNGTAYCTTASPKADLVLQTIADYTFIVNKKKVVGITADKSAALVHEAIVYLQYAEYGRTYGVVINGVSAGSYTTPDGSQASHINNVNIDYVVGQIATSGLASLSGFTVTRYGASFHIRRTDGAAFDISTNDGAQGKDLICITGSVTGIENLPPSAPENYVVEVLGKGKRREDSFFLKSVDYNGETRWVETIAPDTYYKFDKSTMPVTLVRTSLVNGVATFTLDYGEWTDRDVGADDSNPWPSFKGGTIKTVGIFQNRLYVTSGESVCMTRTGQFFNFFRESAQVVSSDDPIDIYADSSQINDLLNSTALDGDLVFFSPNAQFLLPGAKPVTKETATLKQTNSFQNQITATPVPTGESVLFAFDNGLYTGIRELFTDSVIDSKRARPVTEHVDRLIVGQVRHMVSSTNQNWMLSLAQADNIIYLYNWLWVGQEKVQSAWHKWQWPEDERIEHVTFSQDKIYLFISRAEGVYLEVIDVGDPNSYGLPYPARLDRKHVVTATKGLDKYTFPDTFPDEPVENLEYILSTGAYPEYIGTSITFERLNGELVTYDDIGDGDCSLVGGVKFNCTFIPSQPVVKDFRDRVIETDKLKLSQVYLNYDTTGYLKATVRDIYGQEEVNEFNGRVFGDVNNLVGFAPLIDGQFNFPVLQMAEHVTIIITSDSYLPLRIRDMEFSGQFTQRGRRI